MNKIDEQVCALDDPKLALPRKQPRSAVELCNEAHARHMAMSGQDKWLKKVLRKHDVMKREHDNALARMNAKH